MFYLKCLLIFTGFCLCVVSVFFFLFVYGYMLCLGLICLLHVCVYLFVCVFVHCGYLFVCLRVLCLHVDSFVCLSVCHLHIHLFVCLCVVYMLIYLMVCVVYILISLFVVDMFTVTSEACHSPDLAPAALQEQSVEMQSCASKLSTIRDVLLRRHMKVAFFGR